MDWLSAPHGSVQRSDLDVGSAGKKWALRLARWIAGVVLGMTGVRLAAEPLNVSVALPVVSVPANFILESDPNHSALAVRIATTVSRQQLCPTGNLLLPCPAADVRVRYTVSLSAGMLRGISAEKSVVYSLDGNDHLAVDETVLVDPTGMLTDAQEYQLRVVIEHIEDPALRAYTKDQSGEHGSYRFAHFTGSLSFGGIQTSLGSIGANPVYLGNSTWSIQVVSATSAQGHALANTPAAPPPLTVVRSSDGDLSVQSGALEVLGPKGFSWSGWTGTRGLTRLTTQGYVADSLSLELPAGMGWRPQGGRKLSTLFQTSGGSIGLDGNLNPTGSGAGTSLAGLQFFGDAYPLEFTSTKWRWGSGALWLVAPAVRYVRQVHYEDWQLAHGTLPESNDGYWSLVNSKAAEDLEIRPGLAGGLSTTLRFGGGEFVGHFPRASIRVGPGGTARIESHRIVRGSSGFSNASIELSYGAGCREAGETGAMPLPARRMALDSVALEFTPSGGLWADGALTTVEEDPSVVRHLEIGSNDSVPTHRTDSFVGGRFYLPGTWVPRADGLDSALDANATVDDLDEDPAAFNPARYLLSGLQVGGEFTLEHPGTPAYAAGLGDYAGLNLRHFNGLTSRSSIGGVDVAPYPLTTRSKYYARVSGVSGIHESAGGPAELPAYGYDIDLTNFGLSFLSNEAHDSRINGTLHLPYPSQLTQGFERLMLTCCGNLGEGRIAPGDDQKQLAYWSGTRLEMHSLRFTHDPGDPCATEDALLELGVTANVGHLDFPPSGLLYPRPDGTLVPGDDLGRESRLMMPPLATLAGYPFTAVRHGYFNDYIQATAGPGWVSLAGLAGVSFFRDLPIHAQVLGSNTNPPPLLYVKGGWSSGSDNFFNQAGFDGSHRGYPPATNLENYRTDNGHLPHARQVWFGTIDFDYPVRFDGLTRTFASPEPKGIDLAILDVDSELQRLTPEVADLRFSAFFDLSLLSSADLLVEDGISWATGQVEEEAVDSMRRGLDRLSAILDARMRQLLEDILLPAVEQAVVQPLVAALPEDGDEIAIEAALDFQLGAPLTQALQGLAQVGGAGTNLTEQASQAIGGAVEALQTVRGVLMQLQKTEQLILAGLEALGVDMSLFANGLPAEVRDQLEQSIGPDGTEAIGRLVEIRQAIQELESNLGQVIAALEQGQAFFDQLQDTVFQPLVEYGQLGDRIKARLEPWLKFSVGTDTGAYSTEEIRTRVRQEIRDAFAESLVAANLQTVFRTWLYNVDAAVRGALDTAFQTINDEITAIALEALGEIKAAVQPVKTFSSVVESVNWEGRAHIRGDRLSVLRLDNEVIVNVPTPIPAVQVPIRCTGFYEFRELSSDGPVGCYGGSASRLQEIVLGTSVGPASIFGAGNKITLQSKFTRDSEGNLLQLSGGLEMDQQGPEIQVVGLSEFSATLSIGPGTKEFYLSAFARGYWTVPGPTALPANVEMAGGAMLGRACNFEPFSWDPLASEMLNGPISATNAFTGIYLFGEATIPIADLSCVMNASVGAGVRVFINDPNYDLHNLTLGGRIDGEASAEFLCLAKIKGSAFMLGSKELAPAGPFRFDGGAALSGKLGICPLCVEFGGDVEATYVQGQGWSVDY
ncbi:MAG: hypothetical protein JNK85_05330 [Verrucomicrobiales bacterium]|nr:hypothetical protein [Verrucomicrobiales bacterium]